MRTLFGLAIFLGSTAGLMAAPPPILPEVASREVEVTAGIGDVSAPDRGLVALSGGSGKAAFLTREAGHLRCQTSRDGGATFSPEVEVATAASQPVLDHQALLAPDGVALAVWAAPDPAGDRSLYLARSTDYGGTWTVPLEVVEASADLFAVAVGAGGRTSIAWADGATQTVRARTTEDGVTWKPAVDVVVSPEEGGTEVQSLDIALGPDGDVHVVAALERRDGTSRLYTAFSKDGTAFEEPIERTADFPALDAWNARIEVDDDGTVLVAAVLRTLNGSRFGVLRSVDGGTTFVATAAVSIRGGGAQVFPSLTTWPGTSTVLLHLVEGQSRLHVAYSSDGGVSFSARVFNTSAQRGAIGTSVARAPNGRIVIAYIERGRPAGFFEPPLPSSVSVVSTFDGVSFQFLSRVDRWLEPFRRVPVSVAVVTGESDELSVLWEDPRKEVGTTSIWGAPGSARTMAFGPPTRKDGDAFTSRPNARTDPTVAADGDRHVLAVFPVATRSELEDLYVAASADGGRTFTAPVRLGEDLAGQQLYFSPAAAIGSEGVAWVVAETLSGLRLFRSGDFGASWPEAANSLDGGVTGDGRLHVVTAGGGIGLTAWANVSGGQAWLARGGGPGTPIVKTLLSSTAFEATVCAAGTHVMVAYLEGTNVVGRQSTDAGETFGPAFSLHAHPTFLEIACAGEEATAVWLGPDEDGDLHPGQGGIRSATLGPKGWGKATTLGPASFALPKVVRDEDSVVAVWDENGQVWVARSEDGGDTWSTAERLDQQDPEEVRDAFSWNVAVTGDGAGRFWAFWEEELGSEASIVVRRSDEPGVPWRKMVRLSREQPQHAFPRHDFPYNARAASVPGAGLLAYAGPLASDWRSVFVNADDALDADRDGVPDTDDCAPEDPDTQTCGDRVVPERTSVPRRGTLHGVSSLERR